MNPVNPVGRVEEARVGERSKHACDTASPMVVSTALARKRKTRGRMKLRGLNLRMEDWHSGWLGTIGRLVILTSEFFGAPHQWVTDQGVDDEW